MAEDATAAFDQAAAVSLLREHEVVLSQVERALARIVPAPMASASGAGRRSISRG